LNDPYAIDAPFYDLIHEGHDDDIGLWLSFAGRTDLPVLEVGTGTGRIAIALSLAGHEVVGIDPSPAMLAFARQRAEDEAADVTLIEGRVLDLALEADHYGLVLVPADVFLYSEDGEEQLAVLRALAPAMAFNGTLALDLPGPALWLDGTTNGQPLLTWSGPVEDGGTLDVYQVHEDDLALQTRWLRLTYETTAADGAIRRKLSEHSLRYVYRFEAEYLLHMAGLRLEGVYGDYDLGPLTSDSERMIFIARRTLG
jgi:SAM-dependent methyltransferase